MVTPTTITYIVRDEDKLPVSGIFDFSLSSSMILPSGTNGQLPAIQARLISDALTTLDGQLIFTSGYLCIASGLTTWTNINFGA